jgi:hypothetical protein
MKQLSIKQPIFKFLVKWFVFHLLAMIISYAKIWEDVLTTGYGPKSSEFWPVSTWYYSDLFDELWFQGLFADYDVSEFLIYMILAAVVVYFKWDKYKS